MGSHAFVLADRDRAKQFAILGDTRGLFRKHEDRKVWKDPAGIAWLARQTDRHAFAVTWLGPGWVFDPYARQQRADDWNARHEAMQRATPTEHGGELGHVRRKLRLGGQCERLLWAIHQRVLESRSSVLRVPDYMLGIALWGTDRGQCPRQWRSTLWAVLESLTWLHIAEWPDEGKPSFGTDTALLTHVGDLRGTANDSCGEDCPAYDGPRHQHFLVNLGRGFLGVLEEFASQEDDRGARTYEFPVWTRNSGDPSLRRVGKTGQLTTVYLPAKLGAPDARECFTREGHRLLQAIVGETTRAKKRNRRDPSEVEVFTGNVVPDLQRKGTLVCGLLDPDRRYVTFGGNKRRKG